MLNKKSWLERHTVIAFILPAITTGSIGLVMGLLNKYLYNDLGQIFTVFWVAIISGLALFIVYFPIMSKNDIAGYSCNLSRLAIFASGASLMVFAWWMFCHEAFGLRSGIITVSGATLVGFLGTMAAMAIESIITEPFQA